MARKEIKRLAFRKKSSPTFKIDIDFRETFSDVVIWLTSDILRAKEIKEAVDSLYLPFNAFLEEEDGANIPERVTIAFSFNTKNMKTRFKSISNINEFLAEATKFQQALVALDQLPTMIDANILFYE